MSEAETGVAIITPAYKRVLMEWIKKAADMVECNSKGVIKSIQVTGIRKKPDCTRSDAPQSEIQLMLVQTTWAMLSKPMTHLQIQIQNPVFEYSATAYQSEDAFSDTDYSELEYSEISKIESANDESAVYLIIKQTFVLVINNHVFSYI